MDSEIVNTNASNVTVVKKRDERLVAFDSKKVLEAIWKASQSVGGKDRSEAERLAQQVVDSIEADHTPSKPPTVEEIQDSVELVLIEKGHARIAKAYILYRQKRAEIRAEKQALLGKDDIDEVDKAFDVNALRVLKARYLVKDETGKLKEGPKQLFERVAIHVILPEILYDSAVFRKDSGPSQALEEFEPQRFKEIISLGKYTLNEFHLDALKRTYDRLNRDGKMKAEWKVVLKLLSSGNFDHLESEIMSFMELMTSKRFLPNTPAIANFGSHLGMGSACFVLGIDDSMESIMTTLKNTAMVFKAGGGMGYNFSKLRPEGDFVSTTSGVASGPLSFMTLFDTMTDVIKQGGIRRGANMGVLDINHPDIEKFIKSKEGNQSLTNFNISVLITPEFWKYYQKNEPFPLINPRNGKVVKKVNPRMLFDMITYQAWESAEPGVIFYDHVNRYNPFLQSLGPIVTTNPCGEVLLYPNESCNLGSINVWAHCTLDASGKTVVDWDRLKDTVRKTTRFLDQIIDINRYPIPEIEYMTLRTRKIGLGIMGLADLLFELELPYNTEEARSFMEVLMEFINYYSKVESIELAKERGAMPMFEGSFYVDGRLPFKGFEEKDSWHFDWTALSEEIKKHGIRNGYTTIIAPTGSISMIAGCSSGIEPIFSLVFEKNVKVGSFHYVDPVFEEKMKGEELYDEKLLEDVSTNSGGIGNIKYIPDRHKKVFLTSYDLTPEDHIRSLAAFQKWVDSSISKTTNFPASATVEDMRKVYFLAYQLGCKDVTVYRDSSIKDQVLTVTKKQTTKSEDLSDGEASLHQADSNAVLVQESPILIDKPTGISGGKEADSLCAICNAVAIYKEGCLTCQECGWTLCSG
ncbi:MAG: adenosylcobalamin-dependent ribonucleoside-diphosphate reductase [Nitrososphaerales archaeon]